MVLAKDTPSRSLLREGVKQGMILRWSACPAQKKRRPFNALVSYLPARGLTEPEDDYCLPLPLANAFPALFSRAASDTDCPKSRPRSPFISWALLAVDWPNAEA